MQITTKCNMSCGHCGYNCTSKGKHMSSKVWKAALKWAVEMGDPLSIGGGEPTLSPDFWEILGVAIGTMSEYVWLATNGSQTDTSIALASLAKKGVIGCALSLDKWHDPISPKVIEAFKKGNSNSGFNYNDNHTPDAREIRTITKPFKAGRCKVGEVKCVCNDLLIDPLGDVHGCGCLDAPILGNIIKGFDIPDNYEFGSCSMGRN